MVLLAIVALVALSVPAMAARTLVFPIVHETIQVFQAYAGDSNGNNGAYEGAKKVGDVISSVPGILSIVPGTDWSNFVKASTVATSITGGYFIKNVVLRKVTPVVGQCNDIFPAHTVTQHGTDSIRIWWPLMFEVPSTTWTLTITYGTYKAWQDDPKNPASYVHTEEWSWHVDATLESMKNLLELFHEIPFGKDEVPLVGNEDLYPALQALLDAVILAYNGGNGDLALAGDLLVEFDREVADNCIADSPRDPVPNGDPPLSGIAQNECYPACCKLQVDAEYVGKKLGIWIPNK